MRILTVISIAMIMFSCNINLKAPDLLNEDNGIGKYYVNLVIDSMINKYGASNQDKITKGVTQVAELWQEGDGKLEDFKKFCLTNFYNDVQEFELLFYKISNNYEVLNGYFNKISIELKKPLHLDMGDIGDIDELFGSYEPSSHLTEDFFVNKLAFIVMLNFPHYSLAEKAEKGKTWTSKQWAYARIGDIYTSRVPSDLLQNYSNKTTLADTYISEYNIYMGNLINSDNKTFFPSELKLISHWGLRDELKSNYNVENGFEKQKMIYAVMKNIISQEIPESVINSKEYLWNPSENKVFKTDGTEIHFQTEANVRYQHIIEVFNAQQKIDKYNPLEPSYIQRKFDGEMELRQDEVEKLFVDYISSPTIKEVAELIKLRLGRNLEPFDIWYDGFKSRSSINEEELNKIVSAKYPNKEAFEKDLPSILVKLGFQADKADFITSKVVVDASRGAGHAWGSEMKDDKSRLRTRVGEKGMDYKGYNIAVHEFGHNVEQTISLHDVDFYSLRGVPNTAFTEALAFVFQERDLELLNIENKDTNKKHLMALDNFWSTYEIMGVSLVDQKVWKWLYEHPKANAEELKVAVNTIAIEIWNKYYADVFGVKDQPILAIYSHMIDAPLYLSAYPIGLLIQFQLEKHFETHDFATEVQRIYKTGRLIPQLWMKTAVGSEISAQPMIEAATEAVKVVGSGKME
ncbi:MAG: hypothetical protein A2046_03465 [Bacteroidetes bacterium GWA2_30_7]|nr:MAG: hypothetical protein A2046_03465 [Bacteroidetes bacterium GWA2_30_7]